MYFYSEQSNPGVQLVNKVKLVYADGLELTLNVDADTAQKLQTNDKFSQAEVIKLCARCTFNVQTKVNFFLCELYFYARSSDLSS